MRDLSSYEIGHVYGAKGKSRAAEHRNPRSVKARSKVHQPSSGVGTQGAGTAGS